MAGEVVGSVFVRVRAITDKLADDIQDGVSKGVADADVERSGSDLGENLGTEISDGAEKSLDKNLPPAVKRSLSKTERRNRRPVRLIGNTIGERLSHGINEAVSGNTKPLSNAFSKMMKTVTKGLKSFAIPGKFILAGLAVPVISKALIVLGQYIVSLVGQLGYLVTAAVGGGVALGGMFASGLLGVGLLMAAFKEASPAMLELKERAGEVGEAIQEDIARNVQKEMVPLLHDALDLIDGFGERLKPLSTIVGRSFGGLIRNLAAFVAAGPGAARFNRILDSTGRIFPMLMRQAEAFAKILINLWSAASPIAERFTETLTNMLERWQAVSGAQADSGVLEYKLGIWYDRAAKFMKGLSDLTVGLWNMFNVASTSSEPFFTTFANFAAMFRVFTTSKEGQDRIKEIFDNARETTQEFNALLGDIIRMLFGPLKEDQGGIKDFLTTLREDFLPWIEKYFIPAISELKEPLSDLGEQFGELFTKLQEMGTLEKLIDVLTLALDILTEILSIPGMASFAGTLIVIAGAFSIFATILGPFVKVAVVLGKIFIWLIPLFKLIGGAVLIAFGAPAAAALTKVAVGIAVVAAVAGLVYAVFRNWGTIKEWVNSAWQAIQRFVDTIDEKLRGAIEWVRTEVPKAFEKFKDAIVGLPETLSNLAGAAVEWISDAASQVPGLISSFVETVVEGISGLAESIAETASGLAVSLVNWIVEAAPKVPGMFSRFMQVVLSNVLSLGAQVALGMVRAGIALVDWILKAIPKAAGFLARLLGTITGWIIGVPLVLFSFQVRLIAGLIGWIVEAVPKAREYLSNLVSSFVSWAVDFIASIPGHMATAASAIWEWVTTAVPEGSRRLSEILAGFASWALEFIVSIPGHVAGAASAIWDWVTTAVPLAAEKLGSIAWAIVAWVVQTIIDLPTIVAGMATAIWDWVSTAVSEASTYLGGLVTEITTWFEEMPGKLKDTVVETGKAIAKDFAGGFNDALRSLPGGNYIADGLDKVFALYENPFSNISMPTPTMAAPGMPVMLSPIEGALAGTSNDAHLRQYGLAGITPQSVARDVAREVRARAELANASTTDASFTINELTVVSATNSGQQHAIDMIRSIRDELFLRGPLRP